MGDERILGVETDDGLKPIESTGIKKCLRCGVDITPENDSGWEKFVDGRTTQPICKDCDAAEEQKSFEEQSPQGLFEFAELLIEESIEELELSDSTGPISCAISNMKRLQRLLAHLKLRKETEDV